MTDISLADRIADRLKLLRQEHGWSLDRLAELSNVSRATLSRLENAEVSPTTDVLGKLCAAYSMSLTRLLSVVEANFRPLVPRASQVLWTDTASGFTRRAVSPPTPSLAAEIVECELQPGTSIVYEAPPVPGQEHHLVMMEGGLELTVDDVRHILKTGDCLRYQLFGKTEFRTSETQSARYFLVLI